MLSYFELWLFAEVVVVVVVLSVHVAHLFFLFTYHYSSRACTFSTHARKHTSHACRHRLRPQIVQKILSYVMALRTHVGAGRGKGGGVGGDREGDAYEFDFDAEEEEEEEEEDLDGLD